jgi:hypothetical protein
MRDPIPEIRKAKRDGSVIQVLELPKEDLNSTPVSPKGKKIANSQLKEKTKANFQLIS